MLYNNRRMEYRKIIQYLQISLISFFVLLMICVAIRPTGLIANSGISYYGVYGNTLLPYSLGFLLVSVATWRSASIMQAETKSEKHIRRALQAFTILFLGLLLTPHTVLPGEHVFFGSTLFGLQLILGILLVLTVRRDWINAFLLAIAFLSGVASLIYLTSSHGYMIQSQVIFQVSIWLLFIRAFAYLDYKKKSKVADLHNAQA